LNQSVTPGETGSPKAMPKRRVLLIIVNYASAELAVRCVDSLAGEQADPRLDLRIVVVENASGDAAFLTEKLSGRNGVTLLVADRNGGFAYGNNLGIDFAYESGFVPEYFHLLNPDTVAFPGAVSALVEYMENRPRVGITGSSIEHGDGTDWSMAFRFPTYVSEVDRGLRFGPVSKLLDRWIVSLPMGPSPRRVDWVSGASMMVRRKVVEEVGGLDERYFLYFEEADFCFKAQRAGWECWYVPQSRIRHLAGHSTGMASRHERPKRVPGYWFESRRRFFSKNYGVAHAALADLTFSVAFSLGHLRRVIARRGHQDPPHYLRDLLSHSVLLPKNRTLDEERSFRPPTRRSP
jgi:GT2 family glycosyltransferase